MTVKNLVKNLQIKIFGKIFNFCKYHCFRILQDVTGSKISYFLQDLIFLLK